MRPFLIVVLYLAAALLLGAALAYPLQVAFYPITEISHYRLMTRGGMLLALAGLYPLLHYLGVNNLRSLGVNSPSGTFIKNILKGLMIGIGIMSPLVITLYMLNILVIEPGKPLSVGIISLLLLKSLLAGLIVSLIEEGFFRGAVQSAIARQSHFLLAVILTSSLYASLHFIHTDTRIPLANADWLSGFRILGESLHGFSQPEAILDSFLALFMAGVLLSLVRYTSGEIAQCMGIHTGWIIVIKFTLYFTNTNYSADYAVLVGSYDGITGYLAALWLMVLSGCYILYKKIPSKH